VAHNPELGPVFPTVCTAAPKRAVESGRAKCKEGPQAVLTRV
jgi:hypothetical protein